MNITELRIDLPYSPRPPRLLAFISFVVDGWLKVAGAKLIDPGTPGGRRFVSMPARTKAGQPRNGRAPLYHDQDTGEAFHYLDLVFPIHEAGRRYLHDVIFAAYRATVESGDLTRVFGEREIRRWAAAGADEGRDRESA